MFAHRKQRSFLSVYVDDITMAEKKQKMPSMWKKLMKIVDNDEPTSFLDHVYLGCTQRECKPTETTSCTYNGVVLLYTRTCSNALRDIASWRTKRQSSSKNVWNDSANWRTKMEHLCRYQVYSDNM